MEHSAETTLPVEQPNRRRELWLPPLATPHSLLKRRWPQLLRAVAEGALLATDYALADSLLRGFPGDDAETLPLAVLICHLSVALREGHLCIAFSREGVLPPLSESWCSTKDPQDPSGSLSRFSLQELDLAAIEQQLLEGIAIVRTGFFHEKDLSALPLVVEEERIYFSRFYRIEEQLVAEMSRLLEAAPTLPIDQEKFLEAIAKSPLTAQQQGALRQLINHPLLMIGGGPGSGKTYAAAYLLAALWRALPEDHREEFSVAIAAPTGKAAAVLEKSLQKILKEIPFPIFGQTLHNLLQIGGSLSSSPKSQQWLSHSLLIVDESSMVDAEMMSILLAAVPSGCYLVFLGDPWQLPAVGAGAPFAACFTHSPFETPLKAALSSKGACSAATSSPQVSPFCSAALWIDGCQRTDQRTLLDFADAVRSGCKAGAAALLSPENQQTLSLQTVSQTIDREKIVEQLAAAFMPQVLSDEPLNAMQQFLTFRAVNPLRRGILGCEALNKALIEFFAERFSGRTLALPLLITRNHPTLRLSNGQSALWIGTPEAFLAQDEGVVYFLAQEGELTSLPRAALPSHEVAFVLSVHKSQGSEFSRLLVLLPPGSQRFGRELLYTAITRAKEGVQIVSWGEELFSTIDSQRTRFSGIGEKLRRKKPT